MLLGIRGREERGEQKAVDETVALEIDARPVVLVAGHIQDRHLGSGIERLDGREFEPRPAAQLQAVPCNHDKAAASGSTRRVLWNVRPRGRAATGALPSLHD